ncbi:hypothetical protein C0995_012747 [Termitomyces sp. Mi166|nr:hypothetical protein C0995_012747 [Termitomyces sp. Mi166\
MQIIWSPTSHFIWILLTAAVTSYVSSLLLLRWSSTQFASDVAFCFSRLHACLHHRLGTAFAEMPDTVFNPGFKAELLKCSTSLDTVYQQATFELRVGRLSVKRLKPFTRTIERLRRELSRDLAFPQPHDLASSPAFKVLYSLALDLGCAILDSISVIERTILACFNQSVPPTPTGTDQALTDAKTRLALASLSVQAELKPVCGTEKFGIKLSDGSIDLTTAVFDRCSFLISLLQMAQDVQSALQDAEDIFTSYTELSTRLWYPRFSWAWLGIAPSTLLLDECTISEDQEEVQDMTDNTSQHETLRGIAEQRLPLSSSSTKTLGIVLKLFTPVYYYLGSQES